MKHILILALALSSISAFANTSDDAYSVKNSTLSFDLESDTPGTGFSRTFNNIAFYATTDMTQSPVLLIDSSSTAYSENFTFSAEDGSFSLSIYDSATGALVFTATSINSLSTDPDATHVWAKLPGWVETDPQASLVDLQP